jgi:adenosylcobinamide-phosphate synthase
MPDAASLQVSALAFGADPLALLLAALAIDACIPASARLRRLAPGPAALVSRLVRGLERRLNRARRSPATRLMRGALLAALVLAAGAAAGWLAARLAAAVPFGWALELALLLILISPRRAFDGSRGVARALEAGGLDPGREAALALGGARALADRHAVARAAIEILAERLAVDLVAALFWFLVLGLPGLLAYRAASVTAEALSDAASGAEFGQAAARLAATLALLPALLSSLLMALAAAVVPGAGPARVLAALGAMWGAGGAGLAASRGWPLAALAGALDLALAGPPEAWIGPPSGRARAEAADIRRALYLYLVACLLGVALVALGAMARYAA